jgi:hypothetical protein
VKILAVAGEIGATIAEIRLVQPLRTLCDREGWGLRLRSLHLCADADLAWADILVLQRGVTERALRLIERMRAGGGHAVYEIDDLLTQMPQHLVDKRAAVRVAPWVQRGLAAADVVSASTGRLADALRHHARRIEVVPNAALVAAVRAGPRDASGPVTLLLASTDPLASSCVVPAVAQVLAARPGRARVVCIGRAGEAFARSGVDVQSHAALPRAQFAALVASLPNALGLIPLGSTRFDACKSAIKFFDYAALGVPALCSDVPPYADVVVHEQTGLLVANTVQAWQEALVCAIDAPGLCADLAAAAGAAVAREHDLDATVRAWRQLIVALGARTRPAPEPLPWQRLAGRWIVRLREANRERLARRKARP